MPPPRTALAPRESFDGYRWRRMEKSRILTTTLPQLRKSPSRIRIYRYGRNLPSQVKCIAAGLPVSPVVVTPVPVK
jgi:hypothetical protein